MNLTQLKERIIECNYCTDGNDEPWLIVDVVLGNSECVSAVNAIEEIERELEKANETIAYLRACPLPAESQRAPNDKYKD